MNIKPRALEKGDFVGIISPSTTIFSENLKFALKSIKRMGFRVKFNDRILHPRLYTIEEDKLRADDINGMFRDDSVKAILHAKGGYGLIRVLPYIDIETIVKHPKIVVGYSDATVFLSFLLGKCNMTAFHGPMVMGEITRHMSHIRKNSFMNAVTSTKPLGMIKHRKISVLKHGRASGMLVGGCLTSLTHMLGTPYELDTRGKILFLEDVSEYYSHFDEMLFHMKLAGKFDNVKGIVFGEMINCGTRRGLIERIKETLREYNIPMLFGFPSGHSPTNLTVPFGVKVTIDTKIPGINFTETALKSNERVTYGTK
ncbi:LD-carboxypeptidase [Candidatus Auribacterota bacterium]